MATTETVARGRESYSRREWLDAYEALSRADEETPLGAEDLELLARASYMLGRDDEYLAGLQRAHQAHLEADHNQQAVRCASWIGHNLVFHRQLAPAKGWFARAQRLLTDEHTDTVEHGYLLISDILEHLFSGDAQAAEEVATRMVAIGQRFEDRDLVALGMMEQGHALIRQGHSPEGSRLVDETMTAVTLGELSPIIAGIVYCNTIVFCRSVFDLRRAREWTAALRQWCGEQPQMVAHNGLCLVHRAELMALEGGWEDALEELRRFEEGYVGGALNQLALGDAAYQRGEVHRHKGEFEQAEAAFDEASQRGRPPQPGFALLRLAQGREKDAATAIRRALAEVTKWQMRARLLPAYVTIMLRVGDVDAARAACGELLDLAASRGVPVLEAQSLQATGETSLAEGDLETALFSLRRAWETWDELSAIHEAAHVRMYLARCCLALGDQDAATLELQAARRTFANLGATPGERELDALRRGPEGGDGHGLSPRELEVVRLVAVGSSNRDVATALVISEHTVARHLQNIFRRLNVSSRTEASAFAHEHGLLDGAGEN